MKLYLPKNLFASIIAKMLEGENDIEILFRESSLIAGELEKDAEAIGLIPTLDLINHRTYFISGKAGISFDGVLSNSYFYLSDSEGRALGKIFLRGDVSMNEIILTKMLFSERYSTDIEIALDTSSSVSQDQNLLVVGDENMKYRDIENGMSFADQIADMLDLPYVNFVFASTNREALEHFNLLLLKIDEAVEDRLQEILPLLGLDDSKKNFVEENLNSVYFEITENEREAIQELFKLVYYHGILDDMFDLKFV